MKYVCEQCGHSQDSPGTCPSCNVELKEKAGGSEVVEAPTGEGGSEASDEETTAPESTGDVV